MDTIISTLNKKKNSQTHTAWDTKSNWYDTQPYQLKQNFDMMTYLQEVYDRVANTLHKVQQQHSIDHYMTDLKTCTRGLFIRI